MWSIVVSTVSVVIGLFSLIVHFFVFHRLKCTKDLSSCIREHIRIVDSESDPVSDPVLTSDQIAALRVLVEVLKNG